MNYKGTIDYTTSFQYPTPTKITGEPTYQSLKTLHSELKANASSIESNLGGGDHGYLGLVLLDANYALVTPTAFVAPTFPNALVIPATATQVEAIELCENHHKRI